MSDRLTVVFDDPELYRRAKIRAAQEGVPLKRIIEEALRKYLQGGEPRTFDWERFRAWQRKLDETTEAAAETDLSDVKHHLYGYAPAARPGGMSRPDVAEEPLVYDDE